MSGFDKMKTKDVSKIRIQDIKLKAFDFEKSNLTESLFVARLTYRWGACSGKAAVSLERMPWLVKAW